MIVVVVRVLASRVLTLVVTHSDSGSRASADSVSPCQHVTSCSATNGMRGNDHALSLQPQIPTRVDLESFVVMANEECSNKSLPLLQLQCAL